MHRSRNVTTPSLFEFKFGSNSKKLYLPGFPENIYSNIDHTENV